MSNDGARSPRLKRGGARSVKVGPFDLFTTGASRFDLRDPYHFIATMSWPMFFLCLVISELLINSAFALLYVAVPGYRIRQRCWVFQSRWNAAFSAAWSRGSPAIYPSTDINIASDIPEPAVRYSESPAAPPSSVRVWICHSSP